MSGPRLFPGSRSSYDGITSAHCVSEMIAVADDFDDLNLLMTMLGWLIELAREIDHPLIEIDLMTARLRCQEALQAMATG